MSIWGISRIPWKAALPLLAAFEKARDHETTAPLEGMLRPKLIMTLKIQRKKKYKWFGPITIRIPHASEALVLGLEKDAAEVTDADKAPPKLLDGSPELRELLAIDHGLPEWMKEGTGPILIAPSEIERLRKAIEATRGLWKGLGIEEEMGRFAGVLERAGEGDGLMIEV